jgi:hypothetical protein
VQEPGEESLGRQLPVVVRSAPQDVLAGRAGDEHVLAEEPAGNGLGAHEFPEAEAFQSRPELTVVNRPSRREYSLAAITAPYGFHRLSVSCLSASYVSIGLHTSDTLHKKPCRIGPGLCGTSENGG